MAGTTTKCPPTGGVCLREVSAYGRCLPTGGVRLREVSAYGRCLPTGGVCLREVSASGGLTVNVIMVTTFVLFICIHFYKGSNIEYIKWFFQSTIQNRL